MPSSPNSSNAPEQDSMDATEEFLRAFIPDPSQKAYSPPNPNAEGSWRPEIGAHLYATYLREATLKARISNIRFFG